MESFKENEQYILIPKHEEGIEMKSRFFTGEDLLELYSRDVLDDALLNGRLIIYKGNEYFLDVKIPEKK